MNTRLAFMALLALGGTAWAQSGSTYRLEESVFNAAGHPEAGNSMTGAFHRITIDAVGESCVAYALAGSTFTLDAGFAAAYPPPGEIAGLVFASKTDLVWAADGSLGSYNLYRDLMSQVSGLGYGGCEQQAIAATATTDTDAVPVGDGFFYLVTATNSLDEEGTKGFQVNGGVPGPERTGSTCP